MKLTYLLHVLLLLCWLSQNRLFSAYAQATTTTTTTTSEPAAPAPAAAPAAPLPAVAPTAPSTPAAPAPAPAPASTPAAPSTTAPAPAPAPATVAPTAANDPKVEAEKDRALRHKLAAAQLEIVKLRIEMEEFQDKQKKRKHKKRGGGEAEGEQEGPGGKLMPRGPGPVASRNPRGEGPVSPIQPFKGKDDGAKQWNVIVTSILRQAGRHRNDTVTIVDWGSHNGFFSMSFAYTLPKSTVISVDIMADVGKKLVGPNVYRVYGPARHAQMRQKMNIKNNVMCNLVITPEVFSKFSRKGGVLVDYQWIRYPFHIMNFEDTPSFQSWLCAAVHLAKTTFISFPPADVFVDRDRVARNILGATPLKSFIEESVASCSNDKVEIEMFKTPPKQRRMARIDLVNTNLLSSHSCSDVYDSLECEPSPFDKADCSAIEEQTA